MAVRILVVIAVILAAFSAQEYGQIQSLRRDLETAQARATASARASVAEWLGRHQDRRGRPLQRREGLWIDGHPDYTGISTWILAVYLESRLKGRTEAEAKQAVETAIRQSEEWRSKHPGQK